MLERGEGGGRKRGWKSGWKSGAEKRAEMRPEKWGGKAVFVPNVAWQKKDYEKLLQLIRLGQHLTLPQSVEPS